MKRILLSTLLVLTMISSVLADEISFVASAPKSVEVGKQVKITYTINTQTDGEPTLQEFDGLEILMGPSVSTASSKQYINGRRTDSFEITTYTYIVKLHKEGNITIPGASVMVKGKMHTSNPVTIKVLPEGKPLPQSQQNADPTKIPDDRLFIRAEVNKTKVYEQEALLLTYKVYSADVDLRDLDNRTPKLNGCKIQEVELSQSRQFELEHYKGHNYNTFVWQQFVLFPQQTGKLEIPVADYEALVAVQTRQSMDMFEMMFNGVYSDVMVRKKLKSNKIVIDVEKLPAGKPKDFSGAVGQFDINSSVNTNKLKSNQEVNLKVTVKGNGNMKLMGDPVVDFPSEFDVEKIDQYIDRNRLTDKGFVGEREYQYILTPRTAGTYTIPAVKFVYFDTKTGKYKTAESKEHNITVEKGTAPTSTSSAHMPMKEDGKILATDIRHIKLGDSKENDSVGTFYASTLYCLLYLFSLTAFAVAVFVYRKRIKENSNLALVKTKKANSVAVRRLKNAKLLLRNELKNEFYDEILKAVWGYMSDKLNIPLSQLSKENISSELNLRGCDDVLVDELILLLNEGEFARYAPGDAGETMDKVYQMALDVIGKMENTIKK